MKVNNKEVKRATEVIIQGGIVVLPTDTIYGIHCLASNKKAVEKVYEIRKRDPNKPCLILIDDVKQIELFGIGLFDRTEKFFNKIWPGKASIIIPISRKRQAEFEFLHRGMGSLGFRMPDLHVMKEILKQTGPLISTSANFQGRAPAKNITEAKKYFGDNIDLYLDAGELRSVPSSLAEIENGKLKILRRGEVDLERVDF